MKWAAHPDRPPRRKTPTGRRWGWRCRGRSGPSSRAASGRRSRRAWLGR